MKNLVFVFSLLALNTTWASNETTTNALQVPKLTDFLRNKDGSILYVPSITIALKTCRTYGAQYGAQMRLATLKELVMDAKNNGLVLYDTVDQAKSSEINVGNIFIAKVFNPDPLTDQYPEPIWHETNELMELLNDIDDGITQTIADIVGMDLTIPASDEFSYSNAQYVAPSNINSTLEFASYVWSASRNYSEIDRPLIFDPRDGSVGTDARTKIGGQYTWIGNAIRCVIE